MGDECTRDLHSPSIRHHCFPPHQVPRPSWTVAGTIRLYNTHRSAYRAAIFGSSSRSSGITSKVGSGFIEERLYSSVSHHISLFWEHHHIGESRWTVDDKTQEYEAYEVYERNIRKQSSGSTWLKKDDTSLYYERIVLEG